MFVSDTLVEDGDYLGQDFHSGDPDVIQFMRIAITWLFRGVNDLQVKVPDNSVGLNDLQVPDNSGSNDLQVPDQERTTSQSSFTNVWDH